MGDLAVTITASGVLFGFFFAGFWWALNRELKFEEDERHFKLSLVVLLLAMAVLAIFGIVRPLYLLAKAAPVLQPSFKGVACSLVGVFGYMLAELGHYRVFQRPKYITAMEWLFSCLAVGAMLLFAVLFTF